MQRQRYSSDAKAEALRLLAEVGLCEAERRTGIPRGTISSWGNREGVSSPPSESVLPMLEAKAMTVAQHKAALAEELAVIARQLAATIAEKAAGGDLGPRDAVAAFVAVVDKLQLLSGDATARVETLTAAAAKAEAVAIVDQLATRRARAA